MAKQAVVFGVAGPTGGGKSTFAEIVASLLFLFFRMKVVIISIDDYYKDLRHLSKKERAKRNFDVPDALDLGLLKEHIRQLLAGQVIRKPKYDFGEHTSNGYEEIDPKDCDVIIIEGIFLFTDEELVALLDGSAYVDVWQPICYLRRVGRDIRDRDRTFYFTTKQYLTTVLPGYKKYVRPSAHRANRRVHGGGYDPVGVLQFICDVQRAIDTAKQTA